MDFTIETPDFNDLPKLKKLWIDAFDESETVLNIFFRNVFHPKNTLMIADKGTPVSALYLLPCQWVRPGKPSFSGLYVYAVATDPAYRGKGLASALLKGADRVALLRKLDFLFLVPGSASLFSFYERHGYTEMISTFTTTVSREALEIAAKDAIPCQSGGAISYADCRTSAFDNLPAFISYPENHLLFSSFLYRQYGRKTITQKNSQHEGFAILEPQQGGSEVFVKELAIAGLPFANMAEACLQAYPAGKDFVFYHPKGDFFLDFPETEKPLALFRYLKEELRGETHPFVSTVLD